MRRDRLGWRVLKAAMLFGAVGLVGEGLTELGKVWAVFVAPPSVPGQGKIVEHFVFQHLMLPALAVGVCFFPLKTGGVFDSRVWRLYLGSLLVLVSLPEVVVSFRSDLFRPYPFHLPAAIERLQMASVGGAAVNLIQVQHLLFAHLCLMGALLAIVLRPSVLASFAGPRTGELRAHPAC